MHVWSTLDTMRIRSATDCRIVRSVTLSAGRSTFNPHLPSGFLFLRTQEYRLPGVAALDHWRTTIRGVCQAVVARQGNLIFLYIGEGHWRRFDLGLSCVTVQEVES